MATGKSITLPQIDHSHNQNKHTRHPILKEKHFAEHAKQTDELVRAP